MSVGLKEGPVWRWLLCSFAVLCMLYFVSVMVLMQLVNSYAIYSGVICALCATVLSGEFVKKFEAPFANLAHIRTLMKK